MKYLIVGIGNIGQGYLHTRHNIGFDVLDNFAEQHNLIFEDARFGAICQWHHKGRTFHFLKPSTYVNLSGKAVRYWLQKLKIEADKLLIVVDDLNLPLGTLRLKPNGSDGGHNGLKDINSALGTTNYPRLRFGIGEHFSKGNQIDYVLGKWSNEEWQQIIEPITIAGEIVLNFGLEGIERTMNRFNTKL